MPADMIKQTRFADFSQRTITDDQGSPRKATKTFSSSPALQHHFAQASPPSYGNSAAKLLDSQSKSSLSTSNCRQATSRPTISTYRLPSHNVAQPTSIISPMPTSPPYTAGHSGGQFYSPSRHQPHQFNPTTPDSDSDSSSDVLNPYSFNIGYSSQTFQSQNSQQHQAATQTSLDAELYNYPSSYEHTLLPSGLALASPFDSPVPSTITRSFLPTKLLDESGDMIVRGLQMKDTTRIEDQSYAEDEDSSDENYSTRKSFITPRKGRENESFCQVFAKTSPFDPFVVDGYAKHMPNSELSIKLPKVSGYVQEGAQQMDAEAMDDSARRCSAGVDGASGEEGSATAGPEAEKQVFGGSSRYLLIGGLDPEIDEKKLTDAITKKAEIYTLIGKHLHPHGIVLGEAIRPYLINNEAKVCITLTSGTSLVFPPIEQLKQTLSTFGDLQEFRAVSSSENAFLAVFCDSRIGPIAVKRLNKKFIGNAQLQLTLTDFTTESRSATEIPPLNQNGIDYQHLAKHFATVNPTSSFEPDVFKTQSWIGLSSSHADSSPKCSGLSPLRAPFTTTPDDRPFRQVAASSLLDTPTKWNETTVLDSPFDTPTKARLPKSAGRLYDISSLSPFATSPSKDLSTSSELRSTSMTLIEQLNAKFAKLHSFEVDRTLQDSPKWVDEEHVKPFGPALPSQRLLFECASLPVTPRKSFPKQSSTPQAFAPSPRGQQSKQSYSLNTTPKYVAQLGQQARQIEIMKNVPREMMINMQELRTGQYLPPIQTRTECLISLFELPQVMTLERR
ncbi:hypothetical protein QFC22_004422 [Naganishia vaughanmartiniae]|uniref:Uncharacterized protein n=1 Tax=Naganishia vaughanmartiniae TaxID=1424756 RepID=A0ACC2X481_9TREE|nr:hypothetical protein QFC22_004422 [Naganishia vaughanmartiniae]